MLWVLQKVLGDLLETLIPLIEFRTSILPSSVTSIFQLLNLPWFTRVPAASHCYRHQILHPCTCTIHSTGSRIHSPSFIFARKHTHTRAHKHTNALVEEHSRSHLSYDGEKAPYHSARRWHGYGSITSNRAPLIGLTIPFHTIFYYTQSAIKIHYEPFYLHVYVAQFKLNGNCLSRESNRIHILNEKENHMEKKAIDEEVQKIEGHTGHFAHCEYHLIFSLSSE